MTRFLHRWLVMEGMGRNKRMVKRKRRSAWSIPQVVRGIKIEMGML